MKIKLFTQFVCSLILISISVEFVSAEDIPDSKLLKDSWKFYAGKTKVNLQWGIIKKLHFLDDKNLRLEFKNHTLNGTYQLAADKDPKQIKIVFKSGSRQQTVLGVYRFLNPPRTMDLEIIWYAVGKNYPADFSRDSFMHEAAKPTRLVLRRTSVSGPFNFGVKK